MKTVTSEQMAVLDMNTAWIGVSRLVLMENAGRALAEKMLDEMGDIRGRKVLVLCGPGNNGGDGMVAARHLASWGAEVTVILLSHPDRIRTPEARANYTAIKNMPLSIRLEVADTPYELAAHAELFQQADAIVDAILGTGVKGRLSELFASAIEIANSSSALRIAVDIPTGLDPDTGYGEACFNPHLVVTFHAVKPGLTSRDWRIQIAPIGIPEEAELLAGPGQLEMLLRGFGESLARSRVAYIYGDRSGDQEVRQLLESLPCVLTHCHYDSLIVNPQTRQAIVASRAILLADDVNPNDVRPFTTRSQSIILTTTNNPVQNASYVMYSSVKHARLSRETLMKMSEDVRTLSLKIKAPVYVVGDVDTMSDGSESYLNWVGATPDSSSFKYICATVAWMLGSGCRPLLAMASASYAIRSARPTAFEKPSSLAAHLRTLTGF
ncbi:MAG: NAD(P)H-hydrate epimerase [Nitrososphaerota archaeon]